MWMSMKLAWRNLFRNRRRTAIAGTAIGIGLAALIFTDAMMIGMADHLIHSATASFMGEAQIHRANYRESREVSETIEDAGKLLNNLSADPRVADFSSRCLGTGTIASPSEIRPVLMLGVLPGAESRVSQFDDTLQAGTFLAGGERDLVLGARLAELIHVELGDRVVLTVAMSGSGELSQQLFRVSGIYRFGTREMDDGMVLVQQRVLQSMLGLEGQIHEIAINFADRSVVEREDNPFYAAYSGDGNDAVGWQTLMPQLAVGLQMIDLSMLIVGLILFGVVSLGIVNTLFMSIYERMFEFGVLRAVGTRPWHVARLIVLEAGVLAVLSIILGVILGGLITWWVAHTGIDYRGIEMLGVTLREMIYPRLMPVQFWKYPLWVLMMTMLVGIYPAIYAARLVPATAIRKSL